MIIDCISDLHGHKPKLEGGDLLIIAGDLTARDTRAEYDIFIDWLHQQDYLKKVVIAGNHDGLLMNNKIFNNNVFYSDIIYLQDSSFKCCGLNIWGSPWTKTFANMNPLCKAFTCDTKEELSEKWAMIPDDIDILITHSPTYGILDETVNGIKAGSKSLMKVIEKVLPEVVIFGHIHEQGGKYVQKKGILYINGSIVDERYRHVNRARRIIFDEKMPKMQTIKIIE